MKSIGAALMVFLFAQFIWANENICTKNNANVAGSMQDAKDISSNVFPSCAQLKKNKKVQTESEKEILFKRIEQEGLIESFDQYNSTGKSKEDIKQDLMKKYDEYAKKFNCDPDVVLNSETNKHPGINVMRIEKNVNLKSSDAGDALKEWVMASKTSKYTEMASKLKYNEIQEHGYSTCDTNSLDYEERREPKVIYFPCAANFQENFDDNEYDIRDEKIKSLISSKQGEELSSCINERIASGAKISKIEIKSSSSALNNSQDAEKKFGKKGFLSLSNARAQTAKEKILPLLFDDLNGVDFNLYKSGIVINPYGVNGDGTSGPCPYTLNSKGEEVPDSEFDTDEEKKKLDEHKYVKIHVSFEKETTQVIPMENATPVVQLSSPRYPNSSLLKPVKNSADYRYIWFAYKKCKSLNFTCKKQ